MKNLFQTIRKIYEKNIIVIIVVLCVINFLPNFVNANETKNTTTINEQFMSLLKNHENVTDNMLKPKNMWGKSKGKKNGQNIYLSILTKQDDKPLKDAFKKLSSEISLINKKTGKEVFFSEKELRKLYLNNDTNAILSDKLSITDDFEKKAYLKLVIKYINEEIENNKFIEELVMSSYSTEVFADGDINNSGFDLITDLEIMELIMFGKIEKSQNDNARASIGLPALTTFGNSSVSTDTGVEKTTDIPSIKKSPANQSYADNKLEYPKESATSSPLFYNPTGLNPLACETDTNISDALKNYVDDNDLNKLSDLNLNNEDVSNTEKKPTDSTDSNNNSNDDTTNQDKDNFDDITPANGTDWKRPNICNEIFCIEIKFVNDEKGRGIYKANDNCIACHVEFILENMDLLLSKTLTPSKVPGNLLESGKCKKGFLGIKPNINFYTIKKPIPTPPNNNVIFQSSIPIKDFIKQIYNDSETGSGKSIADANHIKQFSQGKSMNSVFSGINQSNFTLLEERLNNKKLSKLQQEIVSLANSYNDISANMEEFNSLLSSTNQMNIDINANSCEELLSKKTCE